MVQLLTTVSQSVSTNNVQPHFLLFCSKVSSLLSLLMIMYLLIGYISHKPTQQLKNLISTDPSLLPTSPYSQITAFCFFLYCNRFSPHFYCFYFRLDHIITRNVLCTSSFPYSGHLIFTIIINNSKTLFCH